MEYDYKQILERLRREKANSNLTTEQLSVESGVPLGTLNKILSGVTSSPQLPAIMAIASALGVSVDYLIYGAQDNSTHFPFNATNLEPMPAMQRLPLLGTIACGEPILAEENIEAYINVPEGVRADFVLRCKGDSMINARINDGDVVFIRQQPQVENGEIAAVINGDGEATLKRVYLSANTIILQPENPKHSPQVYSGSDLDGVRIVGKAVAFLSEIK